MRKAKMSYNVFDYNVTFESVLYLYKWTQVCGTFSHTHIQIFLLYGFVRLIPCIFRKSSGFAGIQVGRWHGNGHSSSRAQSTQTHTHTRAACNLFDSIQMHSFYFFFLYFYIYYDYYCYYFIFDLKIK
jgi:hypothetical protein